VVRPSPGRWAGSGGSLAGQDFLDEAIAEPITLNFEVEVRLKIKPELLGRAEVAGEAEGCVGCDGTLSKNDLINAAGRDRNVLGEAVLGKPHGLEELLMENLTRVNRGELRITHGQVLSVEIHNLNIERVRALPDEAHSPLIVDADAVLSGPGSGEHLKAISLGNSQVLKAFGGVQHEELLECRSLDGWREPPRALAKEDGLSVAVGERAYHRRG
jgi:hypothetical protein